MPIRLATKTDLPQLVQGAAAMHSLTRFKVYSFDAQRTAESFLALMNSSRHCFLVAESASDQNVIGALVGVMEKQIFCSDNFASIMHFDVLPDYRGGGYAVRLLRAFEVWARNRSAVEICFGINSGADIDRLAALAEKLGYGRVGGNFAKSFARRASDSV